MAAVAVLLLPLVGAWALEVEESPGVAIPDNTPGGITRMLTVASGGALVEDLQLELNVTHTARVDLRVTLRSPSGTEVRLHDQRGGAADDLVRTYPTLEVPAESMDVFEGEGADGDWTLRVEDLLSQDTGTLQSWKLILRDPPVGPTVTFSGQARYEDRPTEPGPPLAQGSPVQVPIRFAEVEVFRVADGVVLDRGDTDGDGDFSLTIPQGGTVDLGLRVVARQSSPSFRVQVKDTPSSSALYSVAVQGTFDTSSGNVSQNILATASTVGGGVFNILDEGVRALEELQLRIPDHPGKLTFFWEPGSTDGTFYSSTDDSIHLLGLSSDPDEYDDDVILHECAHFFAERVSRDDSPGGSHTLTESHQDLRLAWSEGFANYFSGSVRDEAEYLDFNTAGGFSFELEGPTSASTATGGDNENAVGAVLWDLADTPDSADETPGVDDDPLSLPDGRARVWEVLAGQFGAPADTTLETFRNGWRQEHGLAFRTTELEELLLARQADFDRDHLFTRAPGLAVPDLGAVSDVLTVSQSLTIEELNVFVDLTHPAPTDLVLTLTSPGGQEVVLFDRNQSPAVLPPRPGPAAGIFDWFQDFEQVSFQTLDAFDGQNAAGSWTLEVEDQASADTGTLNRWFLDVRGRPPNLPDLQAASVSGPGAAVQGATVTVSSRVRNDGDAAAGSFRVRVMLSADRTVTGDDTELGTYTVGGLSAGQEDSRDLDVTVPVVPEGTYFVGVLVDDQEEVAEGDETDNAGVADAGTVLSAASTGVDLAVSAVSAPAAATTPGEAAVSATVVNQGTDPAGQFRLGYFLSTDSSIGLSDFLLDEVVLTGLAGASSVGDSRTVTLPGGILPGSYFLGALADTGLSITESDEGNNGRAASSPTQVSEALAGIDLTVDAVHPPSSGVLGVPFSVPVDLRNAGTEASPQFELTLLVTPAGASGTQISFTDFVKGLIESTAENTSPVDLDGLDFVFDNEDEAQFDCLFDGTCGTGTAIATVLLGPLGPGETRQDVVSVAVPASQTAGDYLVVARVDDGDAVAEADETNNTRTSATAISLAPAQLPDLVVSDVIAPTTLAQGGEVSVTRTLANQGPVGTLTTFQEEYYLSFGAGNTIDAGDLLLGTFTTPALLAGQGDVRTRTVSVPLSATVTASARVAVRVDSGAVITEANETNNEAFSVSNVQVVTSGSLPDLVPTSLGLTGDPDTLFPGTEVEFVTRVTNQGPLAAVTTSVARLYLSTDASFGVPPDLLLAQVVVPPLNPGATGSSRVTTRLATDLPPGTASLILEVDSLDQIVELDEVAQTLVSTDAVAISSAPDGVDLLLSQVEEPFVATPGTTMVFDVLLVNRGTQSTSEPFVTRFFVSGDAALDAGDIQLTPDVVVPGVAAFGQVALQPRLQLPSGVGPGPFFLIGEVDGPDAVAEADETNNVTASDQTFLTQGPIAELLMDNLFVSPSVVPQGGVLDGQTFFQNVGTASTVTTFSVTYQITTDRLVGPFTTLATFVDGPLDVGVSRIRQDPVPVPLTLDAGTYDVCAFLDLEGNVPEAGTGGNGFCQLGLQVTQVSQPPDYVPTGIQVPLTAFQGRSLSVDRIVRNDGQTQPETDSTVGYFLSVDDTIAPTDILVGTERIGPIAPAQRDVGSASVTIPASVTPGTYFFGVIVDLLDEIGDGRPLNNAALADDPITILGSPDLVVTSVTAAATVIAGQDLVVGREIENIGDGDELGPFVNHYFLSLDATFDDTDFFLGLDAVDSLAAGVIDTDVISLDVPFYLSPGTYFLGARADAAGQSAESEEGNNFTTASLPVEVTGAPDLRALEVTFQTTGTTGTPITITGTFRNVGSAPVSLDTFVDLYLSEDRTLDSTDPFVGSTVVGPPLSPQQEVTVTSTFAVPAVTATTYFVVMQLDAADAIQEVDDSLESNTVSSIETFVVVEVDGTPPQPVITYIDASTGLPYPDSDFIPAGTVLIQVDFGEVVVGPPLIAIDADQGPDVPPTPMTRLGAGRFWVLDYPVEPADGVLRFDGGRNVTVSEAEDLAGNPADPAVNTFFSVDTQAPIVVSLSPADGGLHPSGTLTLTGVISDASPLTLFVSVNAGAFQAIGGLPASFSAPGLRTTYQVLAIDEAGNQTLTALRTVFRDADGDGIADEFELRFTDPDSLAVFFNGGDADADGLQDQLEWLNGTDPTDPDTDGDGVSDGQEVLVDGTDPVNAGNSRPVAAIAPGTAGPPRRVTLDGSGSSDPDGDPLTFAWTQTAGPVVTLDDPAAVTPRARLLQAGTYTFRLVVSDGKIESAPVSRSFSVSNLAPRGTFDAAQVQEAGTTSVVDGSRTVDPNGDTVNFNWTADGGNPAGATFGASFDASPSFTPSGVGSGEGTYRFTNNPDDGFAVGVPRTGEVVVLSPGLTPPMSDAGPALRTLVGVPVDIVAAGSRDPESAAGLLTYAWTADGGNPAAGVPTAGPGPGRFQFTPPTPGVYGFTLEVTDPDGHRSPLDRLEVLADSGGQVPVAVPGGPYTAPAGARVTMDASESFSALTDVLAFQWTQVDGVQVQLDDSTTATPSFEAPHPGDYRFELVVTALSVASPPVEVLVRVTEAGNGVPLAQALSRVVGGGESVNGRAEIGQTIELDASGSTDDDALTYSWTQVGGPFALLESPRSARPRFVPLTYGTYVFEVRVSDGIHSDTARVSVSVDGFNEPPIVVPPDPVTVVLGDVASVSVQAVDPDGGTLEFFWAQVSGVRQPFAGQGTNLLQVQPDRLGTFEFELRIFDGFDWAEPVVARVEVVESLPTGGGGGGGGGGGAPQPVLPPLPALQSGIQPDDGGGGGCHAAARGSPASCFWLLLVLVYIAPRRWRTSTSARS